MNNFTYRIVLLICMLTIFTNIQAQKTTGHSEKIRPSWMDNPPIPGNNTFYYRTIVNQSSTLEQARNNSLTDLSEYIKKEMDISGEIRIRTTSDMVNDKEDIQSYFEYNYDIKSQPQKIIYNKVDEYWEYICYPDGSCKYSLHTLYMIAKESNKRAVFDQIRFTRKYGISAVARSIIPGWGQLYKGSTAKGLCIMGGEVALAGGIISFESMRSNYRKKIRQTQNADHIRNYSTKANNCTTFRNICIGGAAALYVYNLVDALVANGAKRTIIRKNKITYYPVASPDCNGIGLSYHF